MLTVESIYDAIEQLGTAERVKDESEDNDMMWGVSERRYTNRDGEGREKEERKNLERGREDEKGFPDPYPDLVHSGAHPLLASLPQMRSIRPT